MRRQDVPPRTRAVWALVGGVAGRRTVQADDFSHGDGGCMNWVVEWEVQGRGSCWTDGGRWWSSGEAAETMLVLLDREDL
jgi:hypothetical protein